MPAACSTVYRQRVCRFPSCRAVFYLCPHCDRGQQYCGARCREKSRRLQRREANRRHQQTPWGREDHRDRQREYRERQRARVTDQSSLGASPFGSLSAPPAPEPVEANYGRFYALLPLPRKNFANFLFTRRKSFKSHSQITSVAQPRALRAVNVAESRPIFLLTLVRQ